MDVAEDLQAQMLALPHTVGQQPLSSGTWRYVLTPQP